MAGGGVGYLRRRKLHVLAIPGGGSGGHRYRPIKVKMFGKCAAEESCAGRVITCLWWRKLRILLISEASNVLEIMRGGFHALRRAELTGEGRRENQRWCNNLANVMFVMRGNFTSTGGEQTQ